MSVVESDSRTPHVTQLLLEDLPVDILLYVLRFCDLPTLGRLCRVSRRFHYLLQQECVWVGMKRSFAVVGSYRYRERQSQLVPAKEQCRVAVNWKRGICRDSRLVHHREKQLPWMQLDGDHLWISYTNSIGCYQVKNNGRLKKLLSKTLKGHQDDVCRFMLRDGHLVSGTRDGSVSVFNSSSGERLVYLSRCHVGDVHSVDIHSGVVVSGSRDATVKIWRLGGEQSEAPLHTINVGDRVWSLAIDPTGKRVTVGNAGISQAEPLHVWDLDRVCVLGSLGELYKRGAGVLDVQYETMHTLLSCGYDTYIRLWDLRSSYKKSALCWEEPYDSALYCIHTDYDNTFLSGSSRHGMIHLWDKRKLQPVQMYYTGRTASPVYSLAFNHSHLYAALDQGINMLDFSITLPD